jgi:GT2 family glycosyltransferase
MKKISLIIVNWNGLDHLMKLLPSLAKLSYPNYEIIIVDNRSTDESLSYIRQNYPFIRIIENNSNDGFAKGNNIGYEEAAGDYILLLNNDTKIIQEDMIQKLVDFFEKNENVAVVQPKILRMGVVGQLDSVGAFYTNTGFLYHYGYLSKDEEKYNKPMRLYTAKGACIMIKREVINRVGLFDPSYKSYFEETDFCHRVWLSGHQVWYLPSAMIAHHIGGTSNHMDNSYIQYHSFKNRINSYIKNLSRVELLKMLPLHIIICIAVALIYLLWRRWRMFLAIVMALWWNVINISHTIDQRNHVQSKIRQKTDKELFFFLKKNQTLAYYMALFNNKLDQYD